MELEKIIPAAESLVVAEQETYSTERKVCLNCETPLTDTFCPHCGQKNIAKRQTIGELLINFVSSFWSFESKFLQTGRLLLFKPGHLARDYNAGKRERYYHPARMYVFISFLYFLMLSTLPDPDETKSNVSRTEDKEDSGEGEVKKGSKGFTTIIGTHESLARYDSVQQTLPASERDGKLMRMVKVRMIKINQRYKGRDDEFRKDFEASFTANSTKVVFLLLPVFALLLKLLYIRRDYYYSEHLVFSIYYYNFFFLAGCVYMIMNQIPIIRSFSWILGLWIVLYLLASMKFMYRQSWRKTIFKYCTFLFVFSFCIVVSLAVNLALTLIFI